MKTGEMYTYVLNNPEARFHRLNMNNASYGFVNGTLVYGETKIATEVPRPDEDWELVPQEVTWQEAIQGWLDGKSFYIELGGTRYTQSRGSRLGCFNNNLLNGFGGGLFREGKWFIVG